MAQPLRGVEVKYLFLKLKKEILEIFVATKLDLLANLTHHSGAGQMELTKIIYFLIKKKMYKKLILF